MNNKKSRGNMIFSRTQFDAFCFEERNKTEFQKRIVEKEKKMNDYMTEKINNRQKLIDFINLQISNRTIISELSNDKI